MPVTPNLCCDETEPGRIHLPDIYQTENEPMGKLRWGWEWGRIVREFGNDKYTLLYFKWITNKDLLHNTGNSA